MSRFVGLVRCLVLTFLFGSSGTAQVFDATVAIPIDLGGSGSFAYSTALADLNRDGIPDLWVRDFVGNLTVWFGGEVSLIHHSPTYHTISGYSSEFLVVDVNDDSIPDVVGASEVHLGSNNGTLITLPEQSVSFTSIEVECFDFSGDGKRDLVFTADSSSLVLLQGDGTGQFTEIGSIEVGGRVAGLTSGFFNSDTRVDVAIALPHDSAVAIYLGNDSAGFVYLATIPFQVPVSKLVAGDFNGDQFSDLCAADSSSQAVTFVDGDGTGFFSNLHTTQLYGRPSFLFVHDFLHDGVDELTISCKVQTYKGHIALLRSEGGIMVVDSELLPMTPSYVLGPAFVADMNSDGVEDVIASPGGNHVNLFMGKGDRKFAYTRSHYSHDYAANSLVGNFNDDPFPDLLLKYNRINTR